jgi:hypothetical protein
MVHPHFYTSPHVSLLKFVSSLKRHAVTENVFVMSLNLLSREFSVSDFSMYILANVTAPNPWVSRLFALTSLTRHAVSHNEQNATNP